MKKLSNPYAAYPQYNCFGCSPTNPMGLKMEFFQEGEEIICTWDPGPDYQGFPDILHGGIQATLMDEIASWLVFVMLDTAGVTSQLKTRFRRPVHISKGQITVKAKLREHGRRLATMDVILLDGQGNKCSESQVDYFLIPREKAEKEMHYPGAQAFLKE